MGTGQLINNEDVKDNSRKVGAGNSFAASFLTAAWQCPIKRRALPLSPVRSVSGAGTRGVVMPAPAQPAALRLQHALPKVEGAGKRFAELRRSSGEQIHGGSERCPATVVERQNSSGLPGGVMLAGPT